MFGKFTNLRRRRAVSRARAAAQAELDALAQARRVRTREVITRTAAAGVGVVVGGACGHFVAEVLHHQEYPWAHWSTLAGAAFGGLIALLLSTRPTIAVPLMCLSAAALLSLAVFDRHQPLRLGSLLDLSIALEGIDEKRYREISAYVGVRPVEPGLRGCGGVRVDVYFVLSLRRPAARRLDAYRSVVAVTRPRFAEVKAFRTRDLERAASGRGELSGTLSTQAEFDAISFTLPALEHADDGQAENGPSARSARNVLFEEIYLDIDGLTTPRGVGTCFVYLPDITSSGALKPVPGLDVDWTTPAQEGSVTLSGVETVPDESEPAPSQRPSKIEATWRCAEDADEDSDDVSSGTYDTCGGVAAVAANWVGPFRDLALVLIGALVSLAMEFIAVGLRLRHD